MITDMEKNGIAGGATKRKASAKRGGGASNSAPKRKSPQKDNYNYSYQTEEDGLTWNGCLIAFALIVVILGIVAIILAIVI